MNLGFESGEIIYWGLVPKGENKIIGSICLWNFQKVKAVAEVGYDLHPNYQRLGLMREALLVVLQYGFEKLQLSSIEAFTHCDNQSSIYLLERCGFALNPKRKDEHYPENLIYEHPAPQL